MAMVDADSSCHFSGGLTVQVGWLGLRVGGHLGAESAFIKWTGWTLAMALPRWQHHKYHLGNYYQNLRSRFGIEHHPYTKSHIGQIPHVCMYVCVCNYSQTTEPICIKIIPANRASDADCYRLLIFEIFTLTIFKNPKNHPKRGVNRHFQAKLA